MKAMLCDRCGRSATVPDHEAFPRRWNKLYMHDGKDVDLCFACVDKLKYWLLKYWLKKGKKKNV